MKKRELTIVNLIILVLALSFGWLAFRLSVNRSPLADPQSQAQALAQAKQADGSSCSHHAPLKLAAGGDQNLNRLRDYQTVCQSFVTSKLMVFTTFSDSPAAAQADAASMAAKLKLFKQSGVTPFVMAEPYISSGAMSYRAYLAGDYDAAMTQYFQQLKNDGVTDSMMGTWVPFPESNVPGWNNMGTEPHDYALCVNKYLSLLKQYFPGAKGSILLSATTYEPDDTNWENGNYISLSPYVDALDRNLVTSVGIEGFPWMSNAKQAPHTIFNAAEFLQPDLAIGMAQVLRTRDIWINTGTFDGKYTNDASKTVHMSVTERKAILDDVLQVATNLRDYQENQYRVSVNLFSEDKSNTTEATDWSYFQNASSEAVLKDFLVQANKDSVPISISDKTK